MATFAIYEDAAKENGPLIKAAAAAEKRPRGPALADLPRNCEVTSLVSCNKSRETKKKTR